jgi:uncharacterized membrane protein
MASAAEKKKLITEVKDSLASTNSGSEQFFRDSVVFYRLSTDTLDSKHQTMSAASLKQSLFEDTGQTLDKVVRNRSRVSDILDFLIKFTLALVVIWVSSIFRERFSASESSYWLFIVSAFFLVLGIILGRYSMHLIRLVYEKVGPWIQNITRND